MSVYLDGPRRYAVHLWSIHRGDLIPIPASRTRRVAAALAVLSVSMLPALLLLAPATAGPVAPDGRIVFASDTDGDWDVWTMNADGSNPTNLTSRGSEDGWEDTQPTWSPDGTRIAFVSSRHGGDGDVFVMTADGTGVTPVTDNDQLDSGPDWSPNGARLVFWGERNTPQGPDWDIFVVGADGTGLRNLSDPFEDQPGQLQWQDKDPDWSPVSDSIVFASARIVAGATEGAYWRIVTMDADGSNQRVVSDPEDPRLDPWDDDVPNFDEMPEWSPDGEWITFATHQQPEQQWDLQIVRRDGTDQQLVLGHELYEDLAPTWSPDGRELLFTSNRTGDHTRAVYSVDVTPFTGAGAATLALRAAVDPDVHRVGGVGRTVDPDQFGRLRCTIRGTRSADVLEGTARRDVICAGRGDDLVVAAAGRDVVYAGAGADDVRGADGLDLLFGGPGADRLHGGLGVDACPDGAATRRTSCEI